MTDYLDIVTVIACHAAMIQPKVNNYSTWKSIESYPCSLLIDDQKMSDCQTIYRSVFMRLQWL